MNTHQWYQMGLRSIQPPNTFIGGVSATISTASALATKLGISVGAISNFTIDGSDIKCKITGSYANTFGFYDNELTYYDDKDGLCTSAGYIRGCPNLYYWNTLNVTSFSSGYFGRECPLLKEAIFPNIINIYNSQFYESNCDLFYIPRATTLGSTVGDNQVFNGIFFLDNVPKTIYCHPSLATNNAGAPDGDIAYAISQGATVRYVTNFTAPSPITTLAAGTIYNTTIQLNFTAPSSANAIDYYDVYLNGVLQTQRITASGQYITGLTPSTSYNITLIAVDIFYNKSVVSNSLSVSTTNTILDSDANAYMVASDNGNWQPEINNLFTSLKSNSLYTKIQAFYPFLGTTASQHKWNAKNPLDTNGAFRLTFTGAATFSDNGYQCNGTNAYADTHLTPSMSMTLNSNGLTMVTGTNNAVIGTSGYSRDIGAYGGETNIMFLSPRYNVSVGQKAYSSTNYENTYTDSVDAKGILTGTRQSSSSTKLFKNGVLKNTSTSAPGTLATNSLFIGAQHVGAGGWGFSTQRIQFTAIHEGLSDAEVATLHTIIDTFENALGRKTW